MGSWWIGVCEDTLCICIVGIDSIILHSVPLYDLFSYTPERLGAHGFAYWAYYGRAKRIGALEIDLARADVITYSDEADHSCKVGSRCTREGTALHSDVCRQRPTPFHAGNERPEVRELWCAPTEGGSGARK